MKNIFPFLDWISSYKKTDFVKDLLAGITVGIVLVPQGMAYAMIAGLPPVHGLYASLFPVLVYALLGTSRKIAVGPVAMDSLLVAVGLGTLAITGVENYIKNGGGTCFNGRCYSVFVGGFANGLLGQFSFKTGN